MSDGVDDTGRITQSRHRDRILAGGCFWAWRTCSATSRAWMTRGSATGGENDHAMWPPRSRRGD